MRFIRINEDGSPEEQILLTDIAKEVCSDTAKLYGRSGYNPPWVGYLSLIRENVLGACCFKSAPINGRVEIAYFTFPGNEGRGIATSMAAGLVKIAAEADPAVIIFAQTLPEENPSTSILKKLGFKFIGEVTNPDDDIVWEWELKKSK